MLMKLISKTQFFLGMVFKTRLTQGGEARNATW